MRHAALFLAAAIACSACGATATDPGVGRWAAISLDKQQYSLGDTIIVTVKNLTALTAPGGFCPTVVQRHDASGWTDVEAPSGCYALYYLTVINDRQSVAIKYPLRPQLPGGLYRLTLPEPVPEDATVGSKRLASPEFTVS